MSPHSKPIILEILNGAVAVAYILLSVSFAAVWTRIAAAFREDRGPSLNPKRLGLALNACFVGSALFLFGCGIHHAHLAVEMIPQSVQTFGPRSLWVVHFTHEAIFMALQAIGAPAMLIGGLYTARSVKLSPAE